MATSVAYRNKLLEFLRGSAPAPPTGIWCSLHSADPGTTGASEISTSGTGYVREQLTFGPAANGQMANTNTPSDTFTSAIGQVPYFGYWDAQSGGNFIEGGAVATVKTYGAGDTETIAAGSFTLSLT